MKPCFCVCLGTCNSCRLCTAPYVSVATLFACAVYVASQNEIPSNQLASTMIPQERRHLQVCTPKSHDLHFHFFRGKKWSWLFFCRKGSISLFNSPPKKRKAKDDFLWQTHLQGFRRFLFWASARTQEHLGLIVWRTSDTDHLTAGSFDATQRYDEIGDDMRIQADETRLEKNQG